MTFRLRLSGHPREVADAVVPALVDDLVASGIADQNPTLWGPGAQTDAEIRLGWVQAVEISRPLVSEVVALRDDLRRRGLDRIVLAGMGGSSLAPEVITRGADVPLVILDSTAPGQVLAAIDGDSEDDLRRTVLVVSSKSGSTVETDSAQRAFEAAFSDLGLDPAERIIVVTDPGSPLEARAVERGYRVFTAQPTVGGRFSALTAFGLVASALAGADVEAVLDEADAVLAEVAVDSPDNPALILGAAIAGATAESVRKDKLGLIVEPDAGLDGLADWIEQLVAESTGKDGTGILPVVLTEVSLEAEDPQDDLQRVRFVQDVDDVGIFEDHYDEILISASLGSAFLVWEYAVAVAGRILGINPFDQPDVEAAKQAARALLEERPQTGAPAFVEGGIEVRSTDASLVSAGSVRAVLDALFARAADNGYIAIQAYVNRDALPQLAGLRELAATSSARPVTFGWGPRFLHSTGQYHKGGPANGVFLQILESTDVDLEIPGRPYTFGQLINAQAAGDARVLADLGRPVVTLTLTDPQNDVVDLFDDAD
ncbi:glucose-6-phosphate isomerase [Microbacterium nymphoidis]|uniref:glucose-6-phosphate isomerase n=1 Tax=Microbacterium nymphoidis TaxID=2898586 RepID=UPI001E5D4E2B|nr:glucose-6-phosphate isomerase [Microbacterium nymphoidis]MCD2497294.1 glucose-6-phosphate isomerase [Microbacterium nymphoidis]